MKSLITGLLVGLFAASGCGPSGPPMGTVSGKVTIGGQAPTDAVRVNFVNLSIGQGAGANIEKDGSYELDQPLSPTEYLVFLTKVPVASDGPATTASETLTSVPKEYRKEETTPLKYQVKEGANVFDVEAPAATAGKK